MAIISLEDIENELVKEAPEDIEEQPSSDIHGEAVEKSEETLNAVFNLDNLIQQHDEALKAIEENKKSIEEVKQLLHDSMVSTNHIVEVLTNSPLKKIAEMKQQNITFESISNHPVETLKSFTGLLKTIRNNISQEAIEEVRRGWFERLKAYFKSFKGEFEYYSKRSAAILRLLNSYKDKLELEDNIELSPVNTILSTEIIRDVSENYKEFISKYTEALSKRNPGFKLKLKSFKQMPSIKVDDAGLYPVSLDIPRVEGHEKVKAYCLDNKFLKAMENGANGRNDFIDLKSDYELVLVKANRPNLKNINDLINVVKTMHETMDIHYRNVDIAGRRWSIVMLSNTEENSRETHSNYGGGYTVVKIHPVNEISAKLWEITKMHNIWGELQTAQRELISKVRVKDNVDYSIAKNIESEIELAKEGTLK